MKPCDAVRVSVSHNEQIKNVTCTWYLWKDRPCLDVNGCTTFLWIGHPLNLCWVQQTKYLTHVLVLSTKLILRNMLKKHETVFNTDLGTVQGNEAQLNLKSGASSKFCKARFVPYSFKPKVEQELDQLVRTLLLRSIIVSGRHPLCPSSSLTTVQIYGDFKVTLKPVLEVDQYPLPRIEDIFSALVQQAWLASRLFTDDIVVEKSRDLLTINTEKSRDLRTINTENGLYRYNRLVYGVDSAPTIWQRTI